MMSTLSKALALIYMLKEGTSAPCDEGVVKNVSVSTLQDASDLRESLACSGQGTFYVEWSGQVNIGDLTDGFAVGNGSSLNVTGSGGGAVINGGNRVRLFTLTEGSQLYLNSVSLENGKHDNEGGAVYATDSSLLVAVDCSFLNNSANNGGGEVLCHQFPVDIVQLTSILRVSVCVCSSHQLTDRASTFLPCNIRYVVAISVRGLLDKKIQLSDVVVVEGNKKTLPCSTDPNQAGENGPYKIQSTDSTCSMYVSKYGHHLSLQPMFPPKKLGLDAFR